MDSKRSNDDFSPMEKADITIDAVKVLILFTERMYDCGNAFKELSRDIDLLPSEAKEDKSESFVARYRVIKSHVEDNCKLK